MKTSTRRTTAAFLLTTAAVSLPSLVWYVAGSRSVANQALLLEESARDEARLDARRLADHLGARLESLRASEGQRPFYHYQPLYHDPEGAYDGASVIPSPLARGPSDPLVLAHFQLDPSGEVSLPTVSEIDSGQGDVTFHESQVAILEQLAACATLRQPRPRSNVPRGPLDDTIPGLLPGVFPPGSEPEDDVRIETLSRASWVQNLEANRLYANLKRKGGREEPLLEDRTNLARLEAEIVEVDVGPFEWQTLSLEGGKELLAALREVETPAGTFTQGFGVCPDSISGWIERAGIPARLVADGSSDGVEAVLPLPSAGWAISVDAGDALASARSEGARLQRRFRRLFFLSVSAAWAVILGVVALVWQTERLANQRSRFAASAAHELKTPLAGLRMYGEMLSEGLGDPSRTKEYARRVSSEADRLARVVTNVMDYTRLERGSLCVHSGPGDLAEAVRTCVERQRPALEALGMTVEQDIPEGALRACFDPDALCHILQNLLDNAEKYSRESLDRTLRISLETRGREAVLRVADRGPGVPEGVRTKLFRPFERGEGSDGPAGLGLGLALSQALARAQGGGITLESAGGVGAVFRVVLPAEAPVPTA